MYGGKCTFTKAYTITLVHKKYVSFTNLLWPSPQKSRLSHGWWAMLLLPTTTNQKSVGEKREPKYKLELRLDQMHPCYGQLFSLTCAGVLGCFGHVLHQAPNISIHPQFHFTLCLFLFSIFLNFVFTLPKYIVQFWNLCAALCWNVPVVFFSCFSTHWLSSWVLPRVLQDHSSCGIGGVCCDWIWCVSVGGAVSRAQNGSSCAAVRPRTRLRRVCERQRGGVDDAVVPHKCYRNLHWLSHPPPTLTERWNIRYNTQHAFSTPAAQTRFTRIITYYILHTGRFPY